MMTEDHWVRAAAEDDVELPDANESIEAILERLDGRNVAVFLDFDGTLAPIVERPEDAAIAEQMRDSVARLADVAKVAIVSGRDLEDVRERVDLGDIAYAGSHGFDIRTADGKSLNPTRADEFLADLDRAEEMLLDALAELAGVQMERKRYSLAVHYRHVSDAEVDQVRDAIDCVMNELGSLRMTHGKRVFDLQPDLDWHKGRAVRTMIDALGLHEESVVPIYIGDDVTDEDAFRTLRGDGVTVVVRESRRPTAADFELPNPEGVRRFLDTLTQTLET